MVGQVQPGAAGLDAAAGQGLLQQGDEDRALQFGQGVAAQAVAVGAEFVGQFGVEVRQALEQLLFQCLPAVPGEQPGAQACADFQGIGGQGPAGARAVELALQQLRVEAIGSGCQQGLQRCLQSLAAQGLQLCQAFRGAAIARGGEGVEHAAAAEGALGGLVAQYQVIAMHRMGRGIQQQLRESAPAGGQAVALQQCYAAGDVLGAEVYMHRGPVGQLMGLAGKQAQVDIQPGGGRQERRGQQPVAAMQVLQGQAFAGEVEGHALAGLGPFGQLVARMQATHPHLAAGRAEDQFIAHLHLPGKGGAGHHHARTGDAEGAVDGQAEVALGTAPDNASGFSQQGLAQRFDTLAAGAGHGEDGGVRERARGQQGSHFGASLCDARGRYAVGFGQGHQGAADAKQFGDGQVLAGLWHHAVVGGDHQQQQVDAAGAGQHVVDEAFVAGHVDEGGGLAVAQVGVEVAEVDGDAALTLGRAAVAFLAGEGFEEGCLAVVDMACGADYHSASSRSCGS
ncbi:hypothetical protein D3C84_545050 [compost metagenome]